METEIWQLFSLPMNRIVHLQGTTFPSHPNIKKNSTHLHIEWNFPLDHTVDGINHRIE